MSVDRIAAIFIKEAQDIRTNKNVLLMFVLPVFLTAVYKNLIPEMPAGFALGFGLLFLATMVGMYVPSMTIAEEKEKRTLEVLMLSPASPADVFMGKGLLTFVSITLTMFILVAIAGTGMAHLAVIVSGMVLTSVTCIFIGMLIGLLVQNQMATGVVGTPVYLLFLLVPMLAQLGEGFIVGVARLIPTHYYFEMLRLALDEGKTLRDMTLHVGYLAGSVIITFMVLLFVYNKKGLEQS